MVRLLEDSLEEGVGAEAASMASSDPQQKSPLPSERGREFSLLCKRATTGSSTYTGALGLKSSKRS